MKIKKLWLEKQGFYVIGIGINETLEHLEKYCKNVFSHNMVVLIIISLLYIEYDKLRS